MFFFNQVTQHHPKVMLTDADIKRLKKNHGVVLFFMNGCGHCVHMKDDWNMAVDECRSSGIGHASDDFVLGAIESGNTNLFKENGISHNVSGYPTILYITSEGIQRGDANHEKYENHRTKDEFIKWIKGKMNKYPVLRIRSKICRPDPISSNIKSLMSKLSLPIDDNRHKATFLL